MRKYTYATLLSTVSYIPGVIVLHRSLQKYGQTKYPFVCICSKNISEEMLEPLKREGINCRRLNRSAIDNLYMPNRNNDFEHWNYTFDKLLLWEMTEYDKIVFLDSDMLVLANIDNLFDYPNFSAIQAGYLQDSTWVRLNSGTIVIEPDTGTCEKLISQIPITTAKFIAAGKNVGDQDVLNDYCPQWPEKKELHLPEGYNLFFKYVSSYHKKYGFNYRKNIHVVHFVGSDKPWMGSRIRKIGKIIKLLFTNPYGIKAYRTYIQQL